MAIVLPSDSDMRAVRRRWEDLLGRATVERDWQEFFAEFPYALSASIPLAVSPVDFFPLARPGKEEPDFYFVEKTAYPFPTYGLIELKTPNTKLLTRYRKKVPILSREAAGAVDQIQKYARDELPSLVSIPKTAIALGHAAHLFIVMGLSDQIADAVTREVLGSPARSLLPDGIRILPFDILLRRFEAKIAPKVTFLLPRRWFAIYAPWPGLPSIAVAYEAPNAPIGLLPHVCSAYGTSNEPPQVRAWLNRPSWRWLDRGGGLIQYGVDAPLMPERHTKGLVEVQLTPEAADSLRATLARGEVTGVAITPDGRGGPAGQVGRMQAMVPEDEEWVRAIAEMTLLPFSFDGYEAPGGLPGHLKGEAK